jgi:signal transduction histidine kinase
MSSTEYYFAADAAIINRLGRELVAKQETALIELIKNSYDADATEVSVRFLTEQAVPTMEIVDNGSGMTKSDLVDGFLRLASDKKVSEPVSPLFGRRRAGKKGIGRFSAHRLGDRLILTTRHRDEQSGWQLVVNWLDFEQGTELSSVPVQISEITVPSHGTSIRIEHLFDEWSDAAIRRCWRNVLRLQQPFPVAPVAEQPGNDPGFSVRFIRENTLLKDETVVADLQTEILDHMHAVIDLRVDSEGYASWRISKNRFAPTTDWTLINANTPEAKDPPPYKHLRDAWMRTHYVILAPELLPSLVYTRVRDELSAYGGIRLYRNGFRVVPYGDPGDDWLSLDELYAKRTFLAPISNRNFFGVVEVRDPQGVMFEEHTSREGLLQTQAFVELRDLAHSVLVTAVGSISDARGKKTRASDRIVPGPHPVTKLKDAVDQLLLSASAHAPKAVEVPAAEPTQEAKDVIAIVQEIQQSVEQAEAELADETAMLRLLATLGMTIAEFSHETGMTFDAFRFDFNQVFEVAVENRPEDKPFQDRVTRARSMLTRLDALTSYLNTLASSRSSRDVRPVSLAKVVEDFARGIYPQARSQSVELIIKVPDYDPLYTKPMHEAEIASVLLNLYTNSVKALKRRGSQRKILVAVDRDEDEAFVRLRLSDTGDGVPQQHRERIFDAFFTTRVGPPATAGDIEHSVGTGLGLWIVNQIASNAGGEIYVAEPEQGYVTTFELLLPKEEENVA